MKTLIMGAAGIVAALMPLQAATITLGGTFVPGEGMVTSVANTTTVNFNDGTAPTTGPISYNYSPDAIVSASIPGVATAPTGDSTSFFDVGTTLGSEATITFSKPTDYFGFYASSIDSYNGMNFYNANNDLVLSIDGTQLATLGGFAANGTFNDFVNVFADGQAENFTKLVLYSDGDSFETDNHAFRAADQSSLADTPEPGTLLLVAPAFLLIAKARRRKK